MDLFNPATDTTSPAEARPLAERMRPRILSEFVGQAAVVGPGTLLAEAVRRNRIFSMILWGPPGVGKTTLARIVAGTSGAHFVHFSAVLSGVKEIRAVIEEARAQLRSSGQPTVLFVDEIHRFNKSQQDAFLHHVESGLLTLIGATTENPSFEVIAPLLSRCRVLTLQPLTESDLHTIVTAALNDVDRGLGRHRLVLDPDAADHLLRTCDGDARTALNSLEMAAFLTLARQGPTADGAARAITLDDVVQAVQQKALQYDKSGEGHYNLISAFHKSLRGSDPDAALYWLARMLMAGEDPLYVARRMVRFASEDIGNADPHALPLTMAAMEAFRFIGPPEGELALAQAAVYLASAVKSNSVYSAFGRVAEAVRKTGSLAVPMHIRNAPTQLMKELGYGRGYQYAHDYEDAYVPQQHLPDRLRNERYYQPVDRGYEKMIKQRLEHWRTRMGRGN
ncbi:replication-associated recombination protein A [Desulfatitalea alkaliphila]|uniref:Replication-associated recombination protein A n=1 Tax=Desulfatitalea alkaliphila TaxID=2929485 RepID=A0AA41R4P5_9BACT|nr:replication-associated recombination protein A [Desulfatitalea alkaliphila]MCJ8501561.1 replication-associated recombination protein A [Desulfatitalea alkaliphila]